MFRSKPSQRAPQGAALRPVAEASGAHHVVDAFAPLPLPEVLEDNSDTTWQLWLAANDTRDFGETVPMELRSED